MVVTTKYQLRSEFCHRAEPGLLLEAMKIATDRRRRDDPEKYCPRDLNVLAKAVKVLLDEISSLLRFD